MLFDDRRVVTNTGRRHGMKKTKVSLAFAFLAIMLSGTSTSQPQEPGVTETLLVTVKGLKAGEGNIRVAVFDHAHREEFPEGEYVLSAEVPAAKEQVTVTIANVAPGEYAIAVIQDLNENKKLDRNFLKIPKEPYGFSGAWKKGAASFEQALIDTETDGFEITIELR
jgi:uncharacterized protein (DUF2141 family)